MMLAILLECAVRSSVLIGAAWLGMTVFRVKSPHIQMVALQAVLIASCLVPLFHEMGSVILPIATLPMSQITLSVPDLVIPDFVEGPVSQSGSRPIPWRLLLSCLYGAVAGVLLLRALLGLFLTFRLAWRTSPVDAEWADGIDVRSGAGVSVPVVFGSAILLPADYASWDVARRRAIIAHEASHVGRGDFYVLLLASLHRAVLWFNPLAWWLVRRLGELAEIRSDLAVVEGVLDRPYYAEILLDFARQAERLRGGLAMARPGTVGPRVEWLLTETETPEALGEKWRFAIAASVIFVAVIVACVTHPAPDLSVSDPFSGAADNTAGLIAQRRAEQMLPRTAVEIDTALLDRYVGSYLVSGTRPLKITRSGDQLFAQIRGQSVRPIYPESETKFFYTSLAEQISFRIAADGHVAGLTVHQDGLEYPAPRAGDAEVQAINDALARRLKNNTPLPGSADALRRALDGILDGSPDYDGMISSVAASLRAHIETVRPWLARQGALETVSFRGVGSQGADVYDVKFANGLVVARINAKGSMITFLQLNTGP